MANYWLVKTEPTTYSFDNLVRDKHAVWDGVSNPLALKHLRSMKKGDLAFVYHTGDQKAVVGVAEVTRDPYPHPKAKDPKLAVVELKPRQQLAFPVTLSVIKATKAFAKFELVRMPRLSVMPVPKSLWDTLMKMAGNV